MEIEVMPYVALDGIPTFKDSFLGSLYDQMVADNTLTTVFYDGTVQSAADFIKEVKDPKNSFWMIFIDGVVSGLFWLNTFEGKTAKLHFNGFSNTWGKKTDEGNDLTIEAGKKAVSTVLSLEKSNGGYQSKDKR